jgi:flavin-binding protein dodecin
LPTRKPWRRSIGPRAGNGTRFHRAGRLIPLSNKAAGGLDHEVVSVQKAIDLNGSGETIQEAVAEALDRARLSLEGITSFEVQRISGVVDESTTTYQVELKVWFTLLERMHG